ncbi:MAG: ABC transporter permease [Candidatus Dadabacteria bacterium]|nr:MAG: ABC transporter permease [Candidatus Dadabacteria bacterium]
MKWFRNAIAIAGRELGAMFVSPIAYVCLSGFAVLSGWIFFNLLARFLQVSGIYMQLAAQRPDLLAQLNLIDMVLQPTFLNMTVILLLLFPLLTMRLLSEERARHTDELLLTSPISTGSIVFGKFLAVAVVYIGMLAMSFSYVAVLMIYGSPPPALSEIASAYLGLLLMGLTFGAIGLFTSSLTSNQIVAAVSCFVVLLLFYVIDWMAMSTSGTTRDVLEYLSLVRKYQDFVKGIVDVRGLVYFSSIVALGLFLSKASLDTLRVRSN